MTISVPAGSTVSSPSEYSPRLDDFQYASQAARSYFLPAASTPTNVGARWLSTSIHCWPLMACHINRSCCSEPVELFHVGCFGSPAHPARKKMLSRVTTESSAFLNGMMKVSHTDYRMWAVARQRTLPTYSRRTGSW